MDPVVITMALFMVLGIGLTFGVYAFFRETDEDWFSRM